MATKIFFTQNKYEAGVVTVFIVDNKYEQGFISHSKQI